MIQQADLSENQLCWLTLAATPGVKPAQWLTLINNGISPHDIINGHLPGITEAPLPITPEQLRLQLTKTSKPDIERSLKWQQSSTVNKVVTYGCKSYPQSLRELASPPLVLFVTGRVSRLKDTQLAIVGSRRCTASGKELARQFANQIAECNISVVSGLAAGIDAAAHRGALAVNGNTLAVIGTGADVVYPKRNQALCEEIINAGGTIVSEFWPGTPPRAQHFPRRNRIIAGLSLGTLVVEATIRSGTLITARLATDIGKEVFAVPGNIHNPMTEGCHYLIQQGAKLVTSLSDILEEFTHLPLLNTNSGLSAVKKSEASCLATDTLLDSVDFDVTNVDTIAERSVLPVSEVMAVLLEYELRGLVAAVPGGYVKLRGK